MKKLLFIPLMLLLSYVSVFAQGFGQFATGVFITKDGVAQNTGVTGSGANQIGTTPFAGDLGTFNQNSGSLLLTGGEVKTFKDANGNVCGASFYYSVHPTGAPANFTQLPLPFKAGCSNGAVFDDQEGPCSGSDQKWSSKGLNLDLTTLCPGSYTIDVYYRIQGSSSSSSSCDEDQYVGSASAPASTATFTVANTAPPPTISGNTTVCPGASTTLTADGCANGTITWSNGATGTSISAPAGTYTAICTTNGCSSPVSDPIVVTESPASPPTVTGNGSVCNGDVTPLTADNCNGYVTWSNGVIGSVLLANAGTYTARCTNSDGCVSEPSLPVTVTEQPPSSPPTLEKTPTACPSGNATITASGCNGTVTWSTGATGSSITAPAGTYSATCTPANGCPSSEAFIIVPPYESPCPTTSNLIVNGSFEAVPVGNGLAVHAAEPGWTELAPINQGTLVIWNNYSGYTAQQGTRLIMMNKYTYGIIAQTVQVQPNIPLQFSFYHKGEMNNTWGSYALPEQIRVDFIDSATNNIISSMTTTAVYNVWTKFTSSFVAPGNKVTVKFVSLNGSNAHKATPAYPASTGYTNHGNLIDNVSLVYSGCVCPCLPPSPAVTADTTVIAKCKPATLTATGCNGGTITWSNGTTGNTLTTTTSGTYTASCVMPGVACPSSASTPVVLTSGPDIEVSCPVVSLIANGGITVRYAVKNNGDAPASGKDTIVVNGEDKSVASFTNLAKGDSVVINYTQNFLACGSTATIIAKASTGGIDMCPADNTCTTTQLIRCFPPVVARGPSGPIDPNYKIVSPARSLEGGIFKTDEWLTYTVHCQNDGLGICHNAIMVDTIDTSKLDMSTLQVLDSWDPVQLTHINANTVSFDFIDVDLTSSFDDLPNSQTEVTFKIKRLPNQPVGTEIYNMAGIYFDHNEVVNTHYAASKIIEPCPASQTSPGIVSTDSTVDAGSIVNTTFRLSGYNGIVVGWEASTDPTFNSNVERIYKIADSLVFADTVNTTTYLRALVQTGGCAITGSKAAILGINCNNLIKNGSFETPALTSKTFAFKQMPSWTNTVDNNTMELHRNYLATATDGAQYVELNGYNWGNIYQDIVMPAGTSITWKVDHKARTYNNEVIKVTLSAPDGSNAQTVSHTGSLNAWQNVSGNYHLAPTQTTVRFKIVGSGGTSGIGNLIDNVSMKYETCAGVTVMRGSNESIALDDLQHATIALNVHPNPVHSIADIDLNGFENGTISLHVLNNMGQLVKSLKVQYTKGDPISVNLSELKSGIYLIKATQDERTATVKVVKN